MVKLSKPGERTPPVSYFDEIDDENVLRALDSLRRRAIGISSSMMGADLPPTSPHNGSVSSTPTRKSMPSDTPAVTPNTLQAYDPLIMTTPKAGSSSSPSSNHSDANPAQHQSPQSILKLSRDGREEFIPKWKSNPSIDTEAMLPRWQRETLAQERAALERARRAAEAKASAQEENITARRQVTRKKGVAGILRRRRNKRMVSSRASGPSGQQETISGPPVAKTMQEELSTTPTVSTGGSSATPNSSQNTDYAIPSKCFDPRQHSLADQFITPTTPARANKSSSNATKPENAPSSPSSPSPALSHQTKEDVAPPTRLNPRQRWKTLIVPLSPKVKKQSLVKSQQQARQTYYYSCNTEMKEAPASLWRRLAIRFRPREMQAANSLVGHKTEEITSSNQGDSDTIASIFAPALEEKPFGTIDKIFDSVCNLGCFSIMEPIFHPEQDDYTYFTGAEDTITHTFESDDEEESASALYSLNASFSLDNRTFESDGQTLDSDELTHRGLNEFGPMMSMLENFKGYLGGENTDSNQRQYISSLLGKMEERLQEYGGYRRRNDKNIPDDPRTVLNQIEEVNKKILRIVEDFIDKQVMKATADDDFSFESTRASYEDTTLADDEETAFVTKDDLETLGDEKETKQNESYKQLSTSSTAEDNLLEISHLEAHDKDLRSAPPANSMLSLRNRSAGDSQTTTKGGLLHESGQPPGHGKFRSSEPYSDTIKLSPRRRTASNDGRRSIGSAYDDEKSFLSSRTGTSRGTAMMNNLSRVFSRSPRRKTTRMTRSQSDDIVSKSHIWNDSQFDEASIGMPPRHPEVLSTRPVRRMPVGMKGARRRLSANGASTKISNDSLGVGRKSEAAKNFDVHLVDTSIDTSDDDSAAPFDDMSA